MNDDFPLLELFTRLRQEDFPLGISEYQALLRALQGGFGVGNRVELARLCRALWVKSTEEEYIFNYHFEQLVGSLRVTPVNSQETTIPTVEPQPSLRLPSRQVLALLGLTMLVLGVSGAAFVFRNPMPSGPPSGPTDINQYGILIGTGLGLAVLVAGIAAGILWFVDRQNSIKNKQGDTLDTSVPRPTLSSTLGQQTKDEVQIAQAIRRVTSRPDEMPEKQYLVSRGFFPITRRQMKQSWRYLRHLIREGPATELDIVATIDRLGRQAVLLHPVLVPRRRNRIELLLLIDQGGSMVPFHALSFRLLETSAREGRLGRMGAYYFHNCPINYLYQDSYQITAEHLTSVLAQLNPRQSVALIISDAGAARGYFNPERLELTQAFLHQLQQRVPHIAWLNPVPQSRWNRSTAGAIAKLIPMFELNQRGMYEAISVLRGRYVPLEHVPRL